MGIRVLTKLLSWWLTYWMAEGTLQHKKKIKNLNPKPGCCLQASRWAVGTMEANSTNLGPKNWSLCHHSEEYKRWLQEWVGCLAWPPRKNLPWPTFTPSASLPPPLGSSDMHSAANALEPNRDARVWNGSSNHETHKAPTTLGEGGERRPRHWMRLHHPETGGKKRQCIP